MTKIANFLKESYAELKKVRWPTRGEAIRLTGYVIGVSLVVGVYVAALDYGFQELLALLINR